MRIALFLALFSITLIFCSQGFAAGSVIPIDKVGDTTRVVVSDKETQLLPEIKETIFEFTELSSTKAKYSFSFTTGEKIDTVISYGVGEPCIVEEWQAVCGTTRYGFEDMSDYKILLEKTEAGFNLTILDLEPNKEYYIDPIIDANYTGTLNGSLTVNHANWFAQTFKALHSARATAISIPTYKIGTPDGTIYAEIHNVSGTYPNIKPTSLLNIACRGSKDVSSLTTTAGTYEDFNLSIGCNLIKDSNYALVLWRDNNTAQTEWQNGTVGSKPADVNNWLSQDSNGTWVDSGASTRYFNYIIWVASNNSPTISSISRAPSGTLIIGQTITITPADLNDADLNKLSFYCSETGTPGPTNTLCTGGDQNFVYPYTGANCSYAVPAGVNNRTVSCRAFDGADFSETKTTTYSIYPNYLHINFTDEKTGAGVKPEHVTLPSGFDFVTLGLVDSNGYLNLGSLTGTTSAIYTITATKTGYGTRTWDLNFGQNNGGDYNFGMRAIDVNSATIPFQYYDINGQNYLPNTKMTVYYKGSGIISGIGTTDTIGKTSFFLDANSSKYRISDGTNDYNSLRLVIKIPLNEKDGAAITPYTVNTFNVFSTDLNSTSADSNWFIYSNTLNPYTITVGDNNVTYFQRQYSFQQKGNETTATLQPYLLEKTIAGTVKIYSKDEFGTSLPNTIIVVKKYISSVLTTVEERYTDSAGTATFSMIYNDTYYLDAYYLGLSQLNNLLRPTISEYVFIWNISQITNPPATTSITIDANYTPATTTIDKNSTGWVNLGTTVFSNGSYISGMIFSLTQDGNSIYTTTYSGAGVKVIKITIPAIDANDLTNNKNFDFNFYITKTDGNVVEIHHTITYVHSGLNILPSITGLKNTFGPTGMAFIALLVTIIVVGLTITVIGNHPSVSIVGGICLLLFGYLGFLPWIVALIACLGGFAFYFLRSGF